MIPFVQSSNSCLLGYVMGMRSFALEENSLYDFAMKEAHVALELTPADAWAHHSIGHVYGEEPKFINSLTLLIES